MARSLQPENIVNSWSQWSGELRSRPLLVKALSGGRSNQSFLLDSDIGKLVLRINGPSSRLPGANRSNEIDIWQAASKQGIAPPLVFVDPQNKYLVSTYINNELPSQAPFNPRFIDQAFDLLNRCHQLNIRTSNINYQEHIEHYWQLIEARNKPLNPALVKQRKPMQSLLESLINSKTPTGLCHHDPVTNNFVGTPERLYLIDWEYAATGLLIMDYAALATEWKLDDAAILERTIFEPELLSRSKVLYRYLCLLWEDSIA